jgi:LysR family transcriptional regulator, nitrogen assimilation regulatory protein
MDLKQLRTFRAVAELGSLSKAADRLRAAQPALSRHIKLLEHELRVELFVRNGRGMLLTSAGRMLLDRTTGLIRQIEQVSDDLKSANGNPSGRVILGLVPTVSAVLSGRFARRVINEFPDVSLRIVESYGGHLVEWLHRGEMDLAIIYGPAVDLHLQVQSIGREDRRRRPARLGPEQAEAGRPEMAGEAEADPAQHLARLARAAGEGAGAREIEARRHD